MWVQEPRYKETIRQEVSLLIEVIEEIKQDNDPRCDEQRLVAVN